jgi:hypothetical protein
LLFAALSGFAEVSNDLPAVLAAAEAASAAATATARSATAAAATTVATTTAAATASRLARSGLVDGQGSTIEGLVVHIGNRRFHLVSLDIDEAESSTLDDAALAGAIGSERLQQTRFSRAVGQISNVK